MTIEEFFKDLSSKLELTKTEADIISRKHNWLREKLCAGLPVEDDFLTGSYSRNTMIRPKGNDKFDVDSFLVFSKQDYGEKDLPELLKIVKTALDKIKDQDSDILKIDDKQRRSIGVIYKNNFQIDIVPAIEIEKGKKYKIWDKRSREALESNPKLHSESLTAANDASASGSIKRLVPIVKLLKSWSHEKCNYIKSFHLELLAVQILKDEEIKSFSSGIGKFFNTATAYLEKSSLKDPANPENIIDSYLDEDGTRGGLLELVTGEIKIVNKALELEANGDGDKAITEWRKIFESGKDSNKGGDAKPVSKGPTYINRTPPKPWCYV